ncbi:MAG TPA: DinB family protein [Solirubrobacter sp.]|nr:DinB family protein [Solirubrobacter sp.]
MAWKAPEVVRVDEPFVADERAMLQGFLDWGRRTLLMKCAGLTGPQLATRAAPPSNLSLLGLVRHITEVERTWFRRRFGGEELDSPYGRPDLPEAAFEDVDPDRAEGDIARLIAEWEAADRAVAGRSLDHVFVSERWGEMSLRWAYSHMVSEYSRHNGHADILRERIDGRTGA